MADEERNAGGQRLRWWTEEEKSVVSPSRAGRQSQTVVEAEAILPDIGQELEEEALRRLATNAPTALVEIYAQTDVVNARALKSMLIVSACVAVWLSGEAIFFHDPWRLTLLPLFVAELAIVGKIMTNLTSKQTRPVVTLSRAGLEVHFLLQNIGLVPWDEIEEIGVFSNCGERSLGIVPKNSDALCRRLPAFEALSVRANSRLCRLFPKKLRAAMAPITISGRLLPMSVDALMAQIEQFRRENNV